MGHMETLFSQLYYLCIPRAALITILSMLVLREKTCRELGIEMKPMAEADYEKCMPESSKFSMKDLASSFLRFPTKIALGMFGGVSTLLAWHPEWQKSAPQIQEQILAQQKEQQDRHEQKQDKILDSMEKAANKPTIENIYGDKNELQNGAQLLKMDIPRGVDPADIAARIAEQQRALLEQKENNSKNNE